MTCGGNLFESDSLCLNAPVTSSRRQQSEQTMAWVAVVVEIGGGPRCQEGWSRSADQSSSDSPLAVLHDDGGQCCRAVVIQAGDGRFVRYGDNGGLFEAGGDCRLVQGEVE